ncbi:hypothetical protein STEG23_008571 [Scotinomys teguina]
MAALGRALPPLAPGARRSEIADLADKVQKFQERQGFTIFGSESTQELIDGVESVPSDGGMCSSGMAQSVPYDGDIGSSSILLQTPGADAALDTGS